MCIMNINTSILNKSDNKHISSWGKVIEWTPELKKDQQQSAMHVSKVAHCPTASNTVSKFPPPYLLAIYHTKANPQNFILPLHWIYK